MIQMNADWQDVGAEVARTPTIVKNGAFCPGCAAATCERSIVPRSSDCVLSPSLASLSYVLS